jgi:hypothetical protein
MVDRPHIDALVELAIAGPSGVPVAPHNAWTPLVYFSGLHLGWPARHEVTWAEADACGRMLAAANALSLRTAYMDADACGMVPEWANGDAYTHTATRFTPHRRPTAVEGLYLIDRYEYQACEAREWHNSQAAAFCAELRRHLVMRLPGYDRCRAWTGKELSDGVAAARQVIERAADGR